MVTLASPFETDAPRTRFSRHDSRRIAKSAQRFRGALAYDVKGNLVTRPASLQSPALSLVWGFDNKLKGADTNGTPATLEVTYEYDALGRRVARSGPGGNVVYFQAGQQTIADYPRGGAPASATYRYVYGSYIDEPLLRETVSGSVRHFFHRNQQYSVTALTDSAGNTAERYAYTAYGAITVFNSSGTPQATSPLNNRYTYTGREWDQSLALFFFRERWFEPVAGRFLSRDPVSYLDYWNLYSSRFAVKSVDPLGLFSDVVIPLGKNKGGNMVYKHSKTGKCFVLIPAFAIVDCPGEGGGNSKAFDDLSGTVDDISTLWGLLQCLAEGGGGTAGPGDAGGLLFDEIIDGYISFLSNATDRNSKCNKWMIKSIKAIKKAMKNDCSECGLIEGQQLVAGCRDSLQPGIVSTTAGTAASFESFAHALAVNCQSRCDANEKKCPPTKPTGPCSTIAD